MPHPVSCGACNATFSIPDEVWEKRVDGQLATLKCRQCKAPIQVDGRARRGSITSEATKGHPVTGSAGFGSRKSSPDPSGTRAAPVIRTASLGDATRATTPKPAGAFGAGSSLKQPAIKEAPVATGVTSAGVASSDWLSPKHTGATVGLKNARQDHHTAQADVRGNAQQPKKEEKPTTTNSRALESSGDGSRNKGKIDRITAAPDKSVQSPTQAATKQPALAAPTKTAETPKRTALAAPTASATHNAPLVPSSSKQLPPTSSVETAGPELEAPAAATNKWAGEAKPAAVGQGGGPPPLRKTQAETTDVVSASAHGIPASPDKPKGPKAGGPPPLPHQPTSHDAPVPSNEQIVQSREEGPRVHSPASMPVVTAMVMPLGANRAVSIPPRQSDIAALLRIRPRFPKWLPFAVLGTIVLLVAGLAALSWTRGDTTAEGPKLGTSSRPNLTYLEKPTASSFAKQNVATSAPSSSASPPDTRAASGAFASQFAQAAAQQRPTTRFDRDATIRALAAGLAKAASCHNRGDPTGAATVTLSISPSGQVLSVTVAPPFATTFTAECIRNALVDAKCPPFQGGPGRLVHSISIH
jgi:hypothetical protein